MHVFESLAGQGSVNLKLVGDRGRGNDATLGDLRQELLVSIWAEQSCVVELFARLGARRSFALLSLSLLYAKQRKKEEEEEEGNG